MNLLDRLPLLDDAELKNLADNARRLTLAGTAPQRQAASDILPAVEGMIAARQAARWEAAAARAAERMAEKRARGKAGGAAAGGVRTPGAGAASRG